MTPKVFICHASEDKERFVLDFATKLRSKGIDAWVDRWEMYPGDSFVDKIFEDGLKNAQAIIIVLSSYSVDKPWVREELNASMIKKINDGSKIIPVIIDDCQVPECLKSTYWVKIKDTNNYDTEFKRTVMSIYGQNDRPPLGTPPSYSKTIIDNLPGLTNLDSLIMKLSCEHAIKNYPCLVGTASIFEQINPYEIPLEEFLDSLEVLDGRGYIETAKACGLDRLSQTPHFSITVYGFDEYARVYIADYSSIVESLVFQIVNLGKEDNLSISESLNQPEIIINHILKVLEDKRFIKISESVNMIRIVDVSPELKRNLAR